MPFPVRSEIVADEADIRNVINEYIIYKRKVHEEAYSTANREKLNEIFPQTETVLFRTVEAEQPKVTYVSMYSPIVLLELTPEQIYRACEADCVTGVYYDASSEDENYDQMSTAESITGTATLRENKGLDGTGIKNGMIENGVPTPDPTYFDTSKITYDEMLLTIDNTVNLNYVTAHASIVASILVGKNDGLVPNAELYCTSTQRTGKFYAGIEWLLAKGVNVINIGNTLGASATGYGLISIWMDHIALQHSVHVAIASCNIVNNYPETYISEAAYAYNVITVGASDSENNVASYSNYSATRYKPDLCAPGSVYVQYGASNDYYIDAQGMEHHQVITPARKIVHGTSIATPMVTAAVVQLCQNDSILLEYQDMLKSVLLAGTVVQGVVSSDGTLNNIAMQRKLGAGVLSAYNAYYVSNAGRCRGTSFGATTGVGDTYTRTFTVSSDDDFIRVALAWLNTSKLTSDSLHQNQQSTDEYTLENLQLTVIAPDGTYWTSYESTGNVQLIAFDPRVKGGTGTYTIRITRQSDKDTKIHFGLAWY